jgi:hypothetical protein
MLTITVIICTLGNQLFPFEVPGKVTVDGEWINVQSLGTRFSRKQCWVETAEVNDGVQ